MFGLILLSFTTVWFWRSFDSWFIRAGLVLATALFFLGVYYQ